MFLNEVLGEFLVSRECFLVVMTLEEVVATVFRKPVLFPEFPRRLSVQHLGKFLKSAYVSTQVRKNMPFSSQFDSLVLRLLCSRCSISMVFPRRPLQVWKEHEFCPWWHWCWWIRKRYETRLRWRSVNSRAEKHQGQSHET